ncbi:TPA: hypothetical protein DDW35_03295 [Candidatus Sumerlaeota bacterium]|nr:hypothetical protein [Candidatus Sumerlaeota bacterium]
MEILPRQITYAEFGKIKLVANLRKKGDQGEDSATTRTTFCKGDTIVLSCIGEGKMGEFYDEFTRGDAEVCGTYCILNAANAVVASGNLSDGEEENVWKTQNATPGKYTIIMEQETGPLAGKLEAKLEITIE